MQLLLVGIKSKNLYNELSEKIETSTKSINTSPVKNEPQVKKKPHVQTQVEYYCNDTRDCLIPGVKILRVVIILSGDYTE
jgi:hypothetical protein